MLLSFFKKIFVFLFLSIFTSILSVIFLYIYLEPNLPQITSLDDYEPNIPSIIYDRNGLILKEMGSENRAIVQIENVPQRIINSFLAAEDSNFYHHIGIDPFGIARAFVANLKAGRVVQGGSTISQQVAKSFLKSKERSIIRKVKDIFLAVKIEQHLSKDQILFLYLNQVYLGGGYYGIKEAFQGYFGKELNDVTIAESAMVAGLLVAPSRYSPYSNPKFAYMRQRYVLSRLFTENHITKEEYENAINESIKYHNRKFNEQIGSHFVEFIRKEIVERLGEEKLLTGGLKIKTTLDLELQKISEEAVNNGVLEIDMRQGLIPSLVNLGNDEAIKNFSQKNIEKFKEKFSEYFVLDKDFNRQLELDAAFSDLDIISNNKIVNHVKEVEFHEAVITSINDTLGFIEVDFLGARGFIDLKGMEWAQIRNLKTSNNWKQSLIRPSTVFKRGHVINVSYIGDSLNGFSTTPEIKKLFSQDAKNFWQFKLFQKPLVQASSISISPFTGEVFSMVGGNKYYPSYFNRAVQSKRQPGSALKPFVYALALEHGFTNSTILYDTPESLSAGASDYNWKPRNYDGKYLGPITFRRSLEMSRNVPTIKLASEIGTDKLIEFLVKLGVEGDYSNDLSLSLGSGAVTLENLTLGYSVFVNEGIKKKTKYIISIEDFQGNKYDKEFKDLIVEKNNTPIADDLSSDLPGKEDTTNSVYDSKLSFIMKSLLRGVIQNGTGKMAKSLGKSVGGKTGTTSDYNDAWFIGFTPQMVTGVWVGFDDNKTLGWPESGSKAALPIWKEITKKSLQFYPENETIIPDGIVNVMIDPKTGKLASSSTRDPLLEVFKEGTEPGGISDNNSGQLDANGQKINVQNTDEDFYDLR